MENKLHKNISKYAWFLAGSELHVPGKWVSHYYDDEGVNATDFDGDDLKVAAKLTKSNKNEMVIRNILFNTEYLSKEFENCTDILQGVIDFWDKFSAEYGNVYKFVLDFDDEGDRMILR